MGIPLVDNSYGVNTIGSGQLPCMEDFHTSLRLVSLCVFMDYSTSKPCGLPYVSFTLYCMLHCVLHIN